MIKTLVRNTPAFLLGFLLPLHSSLGHEVDVHQAITLHASITAADSSTAFQSFLKAIDPDLSLSDATNSLVEGSGKEDDIDKADDLGRKRSMAHFYDPLSGLGLSELPILGNTLSPLGRDSFTWASTRNCLGVSLKFNPNPINEWSWQNARDYEMIGLTASLQSDRQAALKKMFRAVGQVIHLLEDTSQPQHARNEQHLDQILHHDTPWRSPIEDYGELHRFELNYQHAMLDWKGSGFKKLQDFWDRQLYNGTASALIADAGNGPKLGLAEYSNGNFLGARHLYGEYFNSSSSGEYYPFPSRDTSTNYKQVKANPALGLETFTLPNGQTGKGIYIKKTGDGIVVNHHTRMNALGARKISGLTGRPFATINDDKVLADYHSFLIPKALEYSAGLLDYFFRGRIEIDSVNWDDPGQQYVVTVQNISGEPFGIGGEFTIWVDDNNNDRSPVGQVVTLTQAMADGDTMQLTFPGPQVSAAAHYTVLYQGTIGVTGGQADDPVDAGIAVAAQQFCIGSGFIPPEATAWVASLTRSAPGVTSVYAYQQCGFYGVPCTLDHFPFYDITYETITYYDNYPTQPQVILTPTTPYTGPTFWLLVNWAGGYVYEWRKITTGFNSQMLFDVNPLPQTDVAAYGPCGDASCVTAPAPPFDSSLVLSISPCNPF